MQGDNNDGEGRISMITGFAVNNAWQCLRHYIVAYCLAFAACSSFAASGTEDNQWLKLLQAAEQFSATQSTEANFLIPLGKNQKVDGRWLLPESKSYNGVVDRQLFLFNRSVSLQQLSQAFAGFVQQQRFDLQYHCQGRACGSSNFWANDYFSERLLYGASKHQNLWVYRQSQFWYVTYLMQRGNGDVYFQQLKMGLAGSTADTFNLGKRCAVSAQSVPLVEFIGGATAASVNSSNNSPSEPFDNPSSLKPTLRLVLTVSVASDNAWQDAQGFAAACAMRLQNTFNVVLFDSLGLGSINFRFNERVTETEYTLHRFQP
jgi:hypothetical protein